MAKIVKNRVGELIAEKKRQTGRSVTYRDVAEATGLSKNTVGKWVRNEIKEYDQDVIAKFLDYFRCTIADLPVYEETADGQSQ